MANVKPNAHQVHELSTPDLSMAPQAYSAIILCFPFDENAKYNKSVAKDWLRQRTFECVKQLPWLCGTLKASNRTLGKLELLVSNNHKHTHSNYFRQFQHWQQVFDHSYADIESSGFPHSIMSNKYLMAYAGVPSFVSDTDEEETPVFNLQANFIRDGLLISVMCHHTVFDEYWLCYIVDIVFRGGVNEQLSLPSEPMFRISAFEHELEQAIQKTDLEQLKGECPEYVILHTNNADLNGRFARSLTSCQSRPCERTLRVNIARIADSLIIAIQLKIHEYIKATCSVDGAPWMSLDEVLATFLWSHITKTRFHDTSPQDAHNQTSALWNNINFRHLSALDIPLNYFGNAYISVPTHASVDQLIAACDVNRTIEGLTAFADIALSIRKKLASIDRDYIMKRFTLAKSCSDPRQFKARLFPDENRDIAFENKSGLCKGLDFSKIPGTGGQCKPTCTRTVYPKPDNGVLVVQPTDTLMSKDAVEVQVPLWEEDMERLEGLETWMEVARMVG